VQAVSEPARIIARDVTKSSLTELSSADDKITWANAQATLGNWDAAVRGYKEALDAMPNDPDLLAKYASALFSAGASAQKVIEPYESALSLASDSALRERIMVGLALAYLYIPGSYDKALEYINKVINASSTKDALYYFYRACANGQKWRTVEDLGDATQLQTLHDAIMNDARAALAIDSTIATRFRWVADPNFASKDPNDNDLEAFAAHYQDFRELIGMQTP
jgi:tetratricopeptide (TPR) repeat protein